MRWLNHFTDRRRGEGLAERAVKAFFEARYPDEYVLGVVLCVGESSEDSTLLAVNYLSGSTPTPYRFFRVTPDGAVSECPDDFWPRDWPRPR